MPNVDFFKRRLNAQENSCNSEIYVSVFYQPASSLVNYVNLVFFPLTEHLLASYWKHTDLETLLQRKYLRGCMMESWLACWDWLPATRLLFRKRDRSTLILKWSHQILNKRFSKIGLGLRLQKNLFICRTLVRPFQNVYPVSKLTT